MKDKDAEPRPAHRPSLEHSQNDADAFVHYWTEIWNAYTSSTDDASLAAILEIGQRIHPHLTFYDNDRLATAKALVADAEVRNNPDTEPTGTPPTPYGPRPQRHIMSAAPPSPAPFKLINKNTPPLPISAKMLAFDYSDIDEENYMRM